MNPHANVNVDAGLDANGDADAENPTQAEQAPGPRPPDAGPIPDDGDVGAGADADEPPTIHLADLRLSQQFVDAIRAATLDNSGLAPEIIARIRNPLRAEVDINDDPIYR